MSFDLYDSTVLLTRSGSRLYGISTPASDVDVQGCAIPPLPYWLSNLSFEQSQGTAHLEDPRFLSLFSEEEKGIIASTKVEGTIYNINKYMRLTGDSNANVLDSLFAPDNAVLKISKAGTLLRENAGLFISLAIYFRFVGYATRQLEKMNQHRNYFTHPKLQPPTRAEFDLNAETKASRAEVDEIKAAISKQVDSWEGAFPHGMSKTDIWMIKEHFGNTLLEMSLADKNMYELAEARLGVPMEIREYLQKERAFAKAMTEYKAYQSWLKDRNPARAAMEAKVGYDTKFAVHLIRLLRCVVEVLQTGKYNVCRTGIDADLLMEIRTGERTYEEVLEMSDSLKTAAKLAFDQNRMGLPARPQSEKINELLTKAVSAHLGLTSWI